MSQNYNAVNDIDPIETQEWLDAITSVVANEGADRAHFILEQLLGDARNQGVNVPAGINTPYQNTISVAQQQTPPGDATVAHNVSAAIRWNSAAIVINAGKKDLELGGHISSYLSSAILYDIGFNHFWKAKGNNEEGDLIFSQGHAAPGIYARAFIEGRLTEDQINNFRQEVDGKGISSYPHPHLMPNFWQFPTVSMGLGPLMAIYKLVPEILGYTRFEQNIRSQSMVFLRRWRND